jgi:hypothetical protein
MLAGSHYDRTVTYLGGKRRLPLVKEEVWRNEAGEVVRYSLAYIDPWIFAGDNGRVLGYDNAHGHHHRHFCGNVTPVDFRGYDLLLEQFEREFHELWRKR